MPRGECPAIGHWPSRHSVHGDRRLIPPIVGGERVVRCTACRLFSRIVPTRRKPLTVKVLREGKKGTFQRLDISEPEWPSVAVVPSGLDHQGISRNA